MSVVNLLEGLTDNISIDKDKCVFCGRCAERCILDNIRLNLAPCSAACPLGVNVQGYVQLIARGRDEEAKEMVRKTLPFAPIICRICDHPCEDRCQRRTVDGESVGIHSLKRYLFDQDVSAALICAPSTSMSVAVVGAGPAGLMAAHDLALAGHTVSVYEAGEKAGGLLRSLLPVYKLPDAVLDGQIRRLIEAGVTFKYGRPLSASAELHALLASHQAVILATGTGGARKLSKPGEELSGVLSALDMLRDVRSGKALHLSGDVLVIGGGYVAIDAARAALRQGAKTVAIVYRRTADMFRATTKDIAQARKLGVKFAFTWSPLSIESDRGRVGGVVFGHDMALLDPTCRDYPDFDPAEQRHMKAEHVIVAVGQEPDTLLIRLLGAAAVEADPVTLQFGELPLFVAGDLVLGASSAIRAMASGRKAADSVIRMLAGQDMHYERNYLGPYEYDFPIDSSNAVAVKRQNVVGHVHDGVGDYAETGGVYTVEQARLEASRCLSCGGPVGRYRTCWFCLPCEVECPEKALWVEIPYLLR